MSQSNVIPFSITRVEQLEERKLGRRAMRHQESLKLKKLCQHLRMISELLNQQVDSRFRDLTAEMVVNLEELERKLGSTDFVQIP